MENRNGGQILVNEIISQIKATEEFTAGGIQSPIGSRPTSGHASPASLGQPQPREKIKATFVFPLAEKYQCPVCKDVLRYPVQFEECGHRVCSACFPTLLRVEPRCPIDQNQINKDAAYVDKAFNREILELDVKCNNHEWGCKWEGEFQNAQEHADDCEFVDMLCSYECGARFQKRFFEKHVDKDCPKKIIICPYCDDRHLREDRKTHLDECPKLPMPCPNKCEKKLVINRDQVDHHVSEECPKTKMTCEYEDIGCAHRCNREKLPKHHKSELISHVRMLYSIVMEQKKELQETKAQLREQIDTISRQEQRIEDLERITNSQLVWRIDDYQRKLKAAKSGEMDTIFSPEFYTSRNGYRLMASACLNGDGKGKGTHLSVFISVVQGVYDSLLKWPFNYRTTFSLLDQNADIHKRKPITFSVKPNACPENEPFLGRPKTSKNPSFGSGKFAAHEDIENGEYVKDNMMFIKVCVECDGLSEP
ncbi:hypothetical protein OS493_004246 [Desmophyllum pertusum]|uniref:TNF receptor-associated factor 4 n=1 Tax=Desmophyllum pertusum TaxID=174260 RepID=A0A9X0D555_9CNID|nr:hypothetical protein OS493_004246 [Desmophyllum pertusum]